MAYVCDVPLLPKRDMSYKKTSSEVYSDAWGQYKKRCESEGLIPLSRFCATIGVEVQRLYEWLRRRKISISDYQSRFASEENAAESELAGFCEVQVETCGIPDIGEREHCVDTARDIRIEVGNGICVSVSGIGLCEIADLVVELRRRADVGA